MKKKLAVDFMNKFDIVNLRVCLWLTFPRVKWTDANHDGIA